MHVMVGDTNSNVHLGRLKATGWGRMFVDRRPRPYPFEKWGFDNGAFGAWKQNLGFPEKDFLRRTEEAETVNSDPYLAVTPDIVAAGLHSLDFSLKWRPRLPSWPWYLAVQDGMEVADVEPCLHLFSGIFLGGSDRFKATGYRWSKLAHKYQLKFHYGRAGTPAKLRSAYRMGADSCDSAFPLWSAERMQKFLATWNGLSLQGILEGTH